MNINNARSTTVEASSMPVLLVEKVTGADLKFQVSFSISAMYSLMQSFRLQNLTAEVNTV